MGIEFIITSLIVVIIPGTGVLYTLAIGLNQGFRASIAAAFGCTLGIIPAATVGIFGLSAIFHTSALAFQIIKVFGVLYLFYMAWSIWQDNSVSDVDEAPALQNHLHIAVTGTLINVLNPKLSLFFLAFLPQFLPPNTEHIATYLVGLALGFMSMTFVVFVVYGAFAAKARRYVIDRPSAMTWIKGLFAGSFALLGLRLAFSQT
jgi:threonine/homoserine/homoserine lactone efflux protein